MTFIDDGPYSAKRYGLDFNALPVSSRVELRRFEATVYTLESRPLPSLGGSVLVLKDRRGRLRWARTPYKPDGRLGMIQLHKAETRWDFGWRISMCPDLQECGALYIAPQGSFRYFHHSW